MTKELTQPVPNSVTESQDLEVARRTNFAQKLYDRAVEMAEGTQQRVLLIVNGNDEARYEFAPKEAEVDPSTSSNISPVTIFEASAQLPSSVEGQNGHGKSMKEPVVNEALVDKKRREQQNRAMFSGIKGKTVFKNGQAVNVRESHGNSENGKGSKRKGRRNGSR